MEDKEFHYKYNSEGFLIKKISKTESVKRFSLIVDNDDLGNKATWHYLWNANGSLKSVVDPSNKRSEYEYDALGRRTAKIIDKREINRYIYDGNVLLHEWKYNLEDRPKLSVAPDGNLNYEGEEPLRKDLLTTWIFDEGSFAPTAKLVGDKQYSIITDYLGTPVEAYDVSGKKVWECQLDVYGKVRNCVGGEAFIPFRFMGQVHDVETGLYYNRFRYYDPEIGNYVSQDPIGLAGGNPTLYGYVFDSNKEVDVFGLSGIDYVFGQPLPDNEIVTYLTNPTENSFKLREVDKLPITDSKNTSNIVSNPGKSVSVATDMSIKTEHIQTFGSERPFRRGDIVSAASVSDIRAAGFDVVYAPTLNNPKHARIIAGANSFDDIGRSWLAIAFDTFGKLSNSGAKKLNGC